MLALMTDGEPVHGLKQQVINQGDGCKRQGKRRDPVFLFFLCYVAVKIKKRLVI